jgi:hypothetical protein
LARKAVNSSSRRPGLAVTKTTTRIILLSMPDRRLKARDDTRRD